MRFLYPPDIENNLINSLFYPYIGDDNLKTSITSVLNTPLEIVSGNLFRCLACGALRRFDYIGHTYDRFNRKFDVYTCADCGQQITFLVEGKR